MIFFDQIADRCHHFAFLLVRPLIGAGVGVVTGKRVLSPKNDLPRVDS
jgi:hypothetical protein